VPDVEVLALRQAQPDLRSHHLLGIDPHATLTDRQGRPIPIAGDGRVRGELRCRRADGGDPCHSSFDVGVNRRPTQDKLEPIEKPATTDDPELLRQPPSN
jgi:hypothetical protein